MKAKVNNLKKRFTFLSKLPYLISIGLIFVSIGFVVALREDLQILLLGDDARGSWVGHAELLRLGAAFGICSIIIILMFYYKLRHEKIEKFRIKFMLSVFVTLLLSLLVSFGIIGLFVLLSDIQLDLYIYDLLLLGFIVSIFGIYIKGDALIGFMKKADSLVDADRKAGNQYITNIFVVIIPSAVFLFVLISTAGSQTVELLVTTILVILINTYLSITGNSHIVILLSKLVKLLRRN